jgi:hypothetical protein
VWFDNNASSKVAVLFLASQPSGVVKLPVVDD